METFCFPTMFFSREVLESFETFEEKEKSQGSWVESIGSHTILLGKKILEMLSFQYSVKKKIKSKLLCGRTDTSKKLKEVCWYCQGHFSIKAREELNRNYFSKAFMYTHIVQLCLHFETTAKSPFRKHGVKAANSNAHLWQMCIQWQLYSFSIYRVHTCFTKPLQNNS